MTANWQVSYYADETDPDLLIAWYERDGTTLRNFTGWTMAVEIVDAATNEIEATKTAGVVGGDGSGTSNLNIAFTAADLTPLAGRTWSLRPIATNGSERAVFVLPSGVLLRMEVKAVPVAA